MNPTTLKLALNAASSAWGRTKDYRDQKSREAYDALADAAGKVDFDAIKERSGELLDDSRREAGQVTQAARARLEKAREEIEERRKNGEADTKKARQKISKARQKLGKDASRKADSALKTTTGKLSSKAARKEAKAKKRRKTLNNIGIIALLAAVAAGLYYWFISRPQPGDTPPRVQDFAGEDSQEQKPTLVHSTTTPEGQKVPAAGDLAEEPAERDEELLGSLDEQLAAHRDTNEDEAADEAPEAETEAEETEAADTAAEEEAKQDEDAPAEDAEPELVEPEVDPDKSAAQAAAEAEEEITAEAEETKGAEQTAKLGDLQAQAEELEDEMDREIGRNPDENRGA